MAIKLLLLIDHWLCRPMPRRFFMNPFLSFTLLLRRLWTNAPPRSMWLHPCSVFLLFSYVLPYSFEWIATSSTLSQRILQIDLRVLNRLAIVVVWVIYWLFRHEWFLLYLLSRTVLLLNSCLLRVGLRNLASTSPSSWVFPGSCWTNCQLCLFGKGFLLLL